MKYIAEKDGLKLTVETDDFAQSPREDFDNLGTMICFHKGYNLGDKHEYDSDDYDSWEEMKDAIVKENDVAVILPLYLYDHSGLTISHTPFSCRWDSGQLGWIYVTKEELRKEYNVKRISQKLKDKVETYLIGEVETYDMYLVGDIYGFITKEEDGEEDSCWGFYGSDFSKNGIKDHLDDRFKELIDELEMVA